MEWVFSKQKGSELQLVGRQVDQEAVDSRLGKANDVRALAWLDILGDGLVLDNPSGYDVDQSKGEGSLVDQGKNVGELQVLDDNDGQQGSTQELTTLNRVFPQ